MTGPDGLRAALARGRPLVLDGAMGTELARSGPTIASGDWVAATLGLPDRVAALHTAYARAGAEVHIANTFATGRHVLEEVGLADRFETLNRDAVTLCRETVSGHGPGWIAGSVTTYVVGSDRANLPAPAVLERNARDQSRILRDAGADMIALEMLFDVPTSLILMRAAGSVGLPVSIGLTCVAGRDGKPCLRGPSTGRTEGWVPLADALPAIVDSMPRGDGWVLSVMHAAPEVTGPALALVREAWDGPVGCYPNAGRLGTGGGRWEDDADLTPGGFAALGREWAADGLAMIGCCCGLGPDHVAALARELHG